MKEKEFSKELKRIIEKNLKRKYEVKEKESLIYKIIINEKLEIYPKNIKKPKRGQGAFQTDLAIFDKKRRLPMVVMEIKVNSLSTHDILIYSTKAIEHKRIYPYLRYGLITYNIGNLTNKFFTHNQGFDFAITFKEKKEEKLIKIINDQIENSEKLLSILENKNNTEYFNTKIDIG